MQQHELVVSPTNGGYLGSSIASDPFVSSDRRPLSPSYLNKCGDLPYLYSLFSPKEATPSLAIPPLLPSGPVSISRLPISFEEAEAAVTGNRPYRTCLNLQYQDIAERYELCLSHLRDAVEELESLRRENVSLRVANSELSRRLGLHSGKFPGHTLSASLADELRRLSVAEPPSPPEESPTSVLSSEVGGSGGGGGDDDSHPFTRRPVAEKQVPLPKSISVRSSGYLKLNSAGGPGSAANRNGRPRVSSSALGGSQRVYVGGGSDNNNEKGGREEDEEEEEAEGGRSGRGGIELEVYRQGMFKTELCNKWEESGECPYGDHCQFAHGIAQLRPVIRHPRYKTELCRMVLSGGSCPYGHRCHFRHSLSPSDHQRLLLRP